MELLETMHAYFRGEKLEALLFILPVGVLMIACAYLLWRGEARSFAIGGIIPLVVLGLILIVTGATVGLRTNSQVAEIEQQYTAAPAKLAKSELERMEKVIANFHMTLILFGVLVVIGLLGYYAGPWDWAKSAGFVLIIAGGIGLAIDSVAERRTGPYMAALNEISASSKQ